VSRLSVLLASATVSLAASPLMPVPTMLVLGPVFVGVGAVRPPAGFCACGRTLPFGGAIGLDVGFGDH
jgi:hypothetical protein